MHRGKPTKLGRALAAAAGIAFIVSCSGPAVGPDSSGVTTAMGTTADGDPSAEPSRSILSTPSQPPANEPATTTASEVLPTDTAAGPASASSHAWPQKDWPTVVAGRLGCSSPAELLSPPRFEDLTGDGRSEAVLHARCSPVTSAPNEFVLIFDGAASETADPAPAASIGDTERLVDSTVELTGEVITLTGQSRSPSAPNCCADFEVTQAFSWKEGSYVRTDFTATTIDPANSDIRPSFVTPSGNIECTINLNRDPGAVLCQILKHEFPIGGCEYQPGTIATVDLAGEARISGCAGDSMIQLSHYPIGYGTTVHFAPADCAVAETGVTCTNRDGHGFTLSRAAFQPF